MHVQNWGTSSPLIVKIYETILCATVQNDDKKYVKTHLIHHILLQKGDSLSPSFNSTVCIKCNFVPILWDMCLYSNLQYPISLLHNLSWVHFQHYLLPDCFQQPYFSPLPIWEGIYTHLNLCRHQATLYLEFSE